MASRRVCGLVALVGFVVAGCARGPALATPPTSAPSQSPEATSPALWTAHPGLVATNPCAAALCGISPPDPGSPTEVQDTYLRRLVLLPIAEDILELANAERRALGLEELAPSSSLMEMAFTRSEDMVARGYFAHEDPTDGSLAAQTLLIAGGYGGRLGENLFSYSGSLNDLAPNTMRAWMSSTAEGSLILDPAFRLSGVGVMGDGSWWTVTQLFAETGPEPRCVCEQP